MECMKQKYKHDPKNGIYGDCYRTCLAFILKVPRDDVPHWADTDDPVVWRNVVQPKYDRFLGQHGLQELSVNVNGGEKLKDVLAWHKQLSPSPTHTMLTGEGLNGVNHAVVVSDGEIVFDPMETPPGLIGPCKDGFYWLTWLVPLIDEPENPPQETMIDVAADALAKIARLKAEIEQLQAENERLKAQIPKWISVEDELPEQSTHNSYSTSVTVYCPVIQCQFTALYNHEEECWEHFAVGAVDLNEWVTHWMPLPEPPENSDE